MTKHLIARDVCELLDELCERAPEKVVYDDTARQMTASALQKASFTVARSLTEKYGIAPETPVAILSGRNVLTPALFLGCVRAGICYAPMDSSLPDERLNQILGVLGTPWMIVDEASLARAEALHFDGTFIVAEELLAEAGTEVPAAQADFRDECDTDAAQAAWVKPTSAPVTELSPMYIIFTSGSTGVPKGVVTSHSAVLRYLDAVQEVLGLTEEDVIASQAPLDYIAAIRDLYLPLLTGAKTIIIPSEQLGLPGRMFETLDHYQVTTICWSAAGLEMAWKMGGFDAVVPTSLRQVLFSGSVISNQCLAAWQENLPKCRFINQYGPTEATASCTYYPIPGKVSDDTVLPIGRPYRHYQVVLLDEEMNEITDGRVGQIAVIGPALALGYYKNEEATAKSFIRSPLHPAYPVRMYLTGDLGQLGEDGELYFHGRMDRQIKHLGHRIELEEIERKALEVEGIREAAALYDKAKSLLILVYAGAATPRDIAIYFRKEMPGYMVPRRILSVEVLPRLANGKTDMKTLEKQYLS